MTQGGVSHRRIGAILVERGLISDAELDAALVEQAECGRPVGEICVDRYGLDRLHLADALAQQWEEIRSSPELRPQPTTAIGVRRMAPPAPPAEEQELRDLLAEAQAARSELESKTDELSARLAALEALVADVTSALSEIRPAAKPATTRSAAAKTAAAKAPEEKPTPARAPRKPTARRTKAATA